MSAPATIPARPVGSAATPSGSTLAPVAPGRLGAAVPTAEALTYLEALQVWVSGRKSELDDLLSNRERLNQGLELMLDSPAVDWGIHIDRVDIKDVALPEGMKRSMSRQAEAERERRSRVITAEGELQASEKLAQAAEVMASHPAALQLRYLQTLAEIATENNSTTLFPIPIDLLRGFMKMTEGKA